MAFNTGWLASDTARAVATDGVNMVCPCPRVRHPAAHVRSASLRIDGWPTKPVSSHTAGGSDPI
jgi:hypothetical protein